MKNHKPTAQLLRETPNVCTVWLIKWPSTMTKQGKAYYATTYPDSKLIFLETAANRRAVATGPATKLLGQVREAIAAATSRNTHG